MVIMLTTIMIIMSMSMMVKNDNVFYQNHAWTNLDVSVYNRQGAIWPVEACVSLWIGRPQTEVPDVEMGVHYFFHL